MKNYFKALLQLEKESEFSKRVLLLSAPFVVLLTFMLCLKLMEPLTCFLIYIAVVIFNMFALFPVSYELQSLRKYIYSLANDEKPQLKTRLSGHDTKELAEAISSIHRLWTSKTDTLKAQTISGAAVLDTVPDPLLMLDNKGYITNCNMAARQFLGNNIIGQNIDGIFATNIFIASVEKVLKNKSDSETLLFHAKKYNNRHLYAHINRLPAISQSRTVAVVALYDTTKALSLEKMQSDFVANASHELRTPLSVISGFIDTLQTTAHDDADARDAFLNIMREQADYMSALIEDLLSLSRIEMGQDKELKDKVNLAEVIDDVVQALKIKAFQNSINIKIVEQGKLPKIIGDNQQIHQIVQNLLDNAIKYAQQHTEVLVELKVVEKIPQAVGSEIASGKAISVSFNNKGAKIDKENLARLTEKFYRMQIHKDMKIKGTGLGLSIAKQIIMHHHGNLTVTSTSYNGTTFTVYLPIKQN